MSIFFKQAEDSSSVSATPSPTLLSDADREDVQVPGDAGQVEPMDISVQQQDTEVLKRTDGDPEEGNTHGQVDTEMERDAREMNKVGAVEGDLEDIQEDVKEGESEFRDNKDSSEKMEMDAISSSGPPMESLEDDEEQFLEESGIIRGSKRLKEKHHLHVPGGQVPVYAMADYYPTTATSQNAIIWDMNLSDEPVQKISESAVRYEEAVSGLSGRKMKHASTIRLDMRNKKEVKEAIRFNPKLLDVVAVQAPNGRHSMNMEMAQAQNEVRKNVGDSTGGRRYGYERMSNPSIYRWNDVGVDMGTKTYVAQADVDKINSKLVLPNPTYALSF